MVEMSQLKSIKTPVSLLQELATKYGYSRPIYEFLQDISKFGTHLNKFHFKVTLGDVEAVGCGSSKMAAKHDAASKALEILGLLASENDFINDVHKVADNVKSLNVVTDNQKIEDSVTNNYISKLNELSMKLKLPAPIYRESSEYMVEFQFKYECRVDKLTSHGLAVKKKAAKQLSAKNMLEKLSENYSTLNNDLEISMSSKKNAKKPTPSFHEQLHNKMTEKNLNYEDFLELFHNRDKESLKSILNKLEIKCSIEFRQNVPPIAVAVFDLNPPETLMAIGTSEDSAKINLISQIFSLLDVYMGLPPGLISPDEDNKEEFELLEEEEEDRNNCLF